MGKEEKKTVVIFYLQLVNLSLFINFPTWGMKGFLNITISKSDGGEKFLTANKAWFLEEMT